jgi:hypothetical protein
LQNLEDFIGQRLQNGAREPASALASATSAEFSTLWSGGRDGRLNKSSVQRIDSKEAAGILLSSITSSRFAPVEVSIGLTLNDCMGVGPF